MSNNHVDQIASLSLELEGDLVVMGAVVLHDLVPGVKGGCALFQLVPVVREGLPKVAGYQVVVRSEEHSDEQDVVSLCVDNYANVGERQQYRQQKICDDPQTD